MPDGRIVGLVSSGCRHCPLIAVGSRGSAAGAQTSDGRSDRSPLIVLKRRKPVELLPLAAFEAERHTGEIIPLIRLRFFQEVA